MLWSEEKEKNHNRQAFKRAYYSYQVPLLDLSDSAMTSSG